MKILISIFFILIIGIFTSKFKVNTIYLEKQKNSLNIKFNIKLSFYLFGIIPIIGIQFKEDGIYFLCFKFPYKLLKIEKDSLKILKDFSVINFLKSLHLKLDQLNINLKIGSEDMILTVFSVFAISTFLSILSAKHRKQINLKQYHYKITPIYNTNILSFQISSKLSIKTYHLIKAFRSASKSNKKDNQIHIKKVPVKI